MDAIKNLKSIPEKSSAIPNRKIENESIIIDVSGENLVYLNETGSRIWDEIDGQKSISAIAEIISNDYEVDYKNVVTDVENILNQLLSKNVISIKEL